MPIFEYKCPNCGHHIEVIEKHDGLGPAVCPKCQETNFSLKDRVPTAGSFRIDPATGH